MDRKALFGYNVSGDNALYNPGSSFLKLSLDERKKDLPAESVRLWLNQQKDLITKHIQKVAKNNRFTTNWQNLPFVWQPCEFGAEIADDLKMGIPSSVNEYLEFLDSDRYKNTPVANITFKETKETRVTTFPFKIAHVDGSPVTDEVATQNIFSRYFTGYDFNMIPQESTVSNTFENTFDPKIISEIRETLRLMIVKLEAIMPHMFRSMLRECQYPNFQALEAAFFDYQKVSSKKVDLTKFPTLLKIISTPSSKQFRIESKMVLVRGFLQPFFRSLPQDNTRFKYGEFEFDRLEGTKSKFVYDPFMNFLSFMIIMTGESHKQLSFWLEKLATKLNKRLELIDMYDILENKLYLYELINKANDSKSTLDDIIFER